jgi:hypothetical protein
MKSAAFILLTTGIVLGASMVQTDWSGGPSGEVTTTDWGSDFGSCIGMGWQASGVLTLGTAMKWSRVYDNGSAFLLSAATVNSDAYTDLFKCSSSSIGAILSTGNQNQWSHQTVGFSNNIMTIFAGDLNGDGLEEAIGGQDSLFWWENPGNPDWEWQKRLVEKINLMAGVVLDYDEDGQNDIICFQNDYASNNGKLLLYRNLGNGLAWQKTILYVHELAGGGGSPEMAASYISGDGKLSVAILLSQEPSCMVNILREGSPDWYAFKVLSPPCVNTLRVFPDFVDLDTDGTVDLMVGGQSYDYGRIRWYKGPEFYPYYNLETNDNVYGLASIDYDSDGDMDIIYRGEYTVGMFENTRSPQERFVQRVLMEYPFSNGLDSESAGGLVAPGDFDGDGEEDFVCSFYGTSTPDLYWWRLGEDYCGSGWLNSDILYVYDASWGQLTWEASVPAETQLCFQVRGSDDPTDLGDWSGLITEPADLSSYLADGESYLQYRVTMLSDNPSVSPQLNSVTVTYDPLGIEENPELRLSVSPSPAATTACVRLSLPEPVDCAVSVYGLDGRLVERLHGGILPAGESSFQWDVSSVPSGVYFVWIAGTGVNSAERLVVAK